MIRAVLFDLDGVLVNVEEYHCRALSGALAAYGYPSVGIDFYRSHLHRYATTVKLDILNVRRPDRSYIHVLKDVLFSRLIQSHFVPEAHVVAALKAVSPDGRKMIGVVSNGARESVAAVLSTFAPYAFTGWVYGTETLRKPAPDIYLLMARKLGVDPTECVAVEDRDDGIAAARAAGMRVVVVTGPQDVTVERMQTEGLV